MVWDSNPYRHDSSIHRHASEQRHIAVHFPQQHVESGVCLEGAIFYDFTPNWYTASIPALATPADITGCHIFTATRAPCQYKSIPEPARTFREWIQQLPPAEKRMIASHYFSVCDAEAALVQYLQVKCVLYIRTDGGKRHQSGSFSWILCSPYREQLVFNADPVDGWHWCQDLLRTEAAAIASVAVYLDEFSRD